MRQDVPREEDVEVWREVFDPPLYGDKLNRGDAIKLGPDDSRNRTFVVGTVQLEPPELLLHSFHD